MGKSTGNRSSTARTRGKPLLTGVLIGTLVGVSMAAGVAWYLMKSPSPFLKPSASLAKPPIVAKPAPQPPAATSGVGSSKPRFEFYKVLTDKPGATGVAQHPPTDKPKAVENKLASAYEPQILQAGSFSNQNDADKLKAKLALLGVEANIQTATIPDKGVWYRVRLGPYKNASELNLARNFLKQNGVDATPMRIQ